MLSVFLYVLKMQSLNIDSVMGQKTSALSGCEFKLFTIGFTEGCLFSKDGHSVANVTFTEEWTNSLGTWFRSM